MTNQHEYTKQPCGSGVVFITKNNMCFVILICVGLPAIALQSKSEGGVVFFHQLRNKKIKSQKRLGGLGVASVPVSAKAAPGKLVYPAERSGDGSFAPPKLFVTFWLQKVKALMSHRNYLI